MRTAEARPRRLVVELTSRVGTTELPVGDGATRREALHVDRVGVRVRGGRFPPVSEALAELAGNTEGVVVVRVQEIVHAAVEGRAVQVEVEVSGAAAAGGRQRPVHHAAVGVTPEWREQVAVNDEVIADPARVHPFHRRGDVAGEPVVQSQVRAEHPWGLGVFPDEVDLAECLAEPVAIPAREPWRQGRLEWRDRKSTRLNSSHGYISYAVFCLE